MMKINISNVITVSEPTQDIIRWTRQNLQLPNPEYAKKQRMGFWVGSTPKTINLYETRGKDLVLPYGAVTMLPMAVTHPSALSNAFYSDQRCGWGMPDFGLYPYQQKAVTAMGRANCGILQAPAGSGKTQMGLALIAGFHKRALWVTHTLDLLKQSRDRALQFFDKKWIGTIAEGKVNIGEGITFATVQTLSKMDLTQYKDLWDVVIVDECHRVSGSPTTVSMFYKVLNSLAARHKYGLSATVHRADGLIQATYAMIGMVQYQVSEEEVADKIMRVGILPVQTDAKISFGALNTDGTLNYTKLINTLAGNESRNKLISEKITSEEGRSCLILSDRLEHLERLISMLPGWMRQDAVMISGKMTSKKGKAERELALEKMRSGEKKYLFATYSLAKEGLDVPRLERLFLTTPQKDYAVITQSIGRVARTFDGKADPIAYDFVDDIGFCVKAYKKRCTTYRKNNCYWVDE